MEKNENQSHIIANPKVESIEDLHLVRFVNI